MFVCFQFHSDHFLFSIKKYIESAYAALSLFILILCFFEYLLIYLYALFQAVKLIHVAARI